MPNRNTHGTRIKNPNSSSKYAQKIRLRGNTFGQPEIKGESVEMPSGYHAISSRGAEEARRREEVRIANFRFWGLNPFI